MPLVVAWIGPDRTYRQQPVSTPERAEALKKFLAAKGTTAEIKKVAHAPTW